MKSIFINENDQLRSGWRAAIFLIAFTFVALVMGTLAQIILDSLLIDPSNKIVYLSVNAILSLIPAMLIGWACGNLFENLPFLALGAAFTKGWLKHLCIGIVIGSATLGFAVLIAVVFGGLLFAMNDTGTAAVIQSLATSLLVFGLASAFEEALFRGYILQTFSRSGLAWLAILLTSVFFGAVHLGNPNANLISTLNTVFAGIWFSIAYLKTRDLWFVWGLHFMWNWTQGSIFGIEVSGLTDITTTPLLKEIDKGPTWLTGEAYGIEGGVACTAAIIISTVVIYYLTILRPDEKLLAMTTKSERF